MSDSHTSHDHAEGCGCDACANELEIHSLPGEIEENNGFAGNIDVETNETVLEAYDDFHPTLDDWTITQMIDDLANLSSWTTSSVTFSFPTVESSDYAGTVLEGTLEAFSAMQQAATRLAIEMIGDLIDLDFVDSGNDVNAEIRIHNSTLAGTAAAVPAGPGVGGDIWVFNYDPATVNDYDLLQGNYHYHTILHELGHALGLSHTSFDDSMVEFEDRAGYLQDSALFSMMSYNTAYEAGADWASSYASTPMIADIAALQSIYGANTTTRTGDTVYGFNSTADRNAFDFDDLMESQGFIPAMAIWDAGGIDTLDMSGFGRKSVIDLAEGSSSSVGGFDMNLSIAHGAVVENAIGGSGHDDIRGNDVDNTLTGGIGRDTMDGGLGDDLLVGDDPAIVEGDLNHGTLELDGFEEISLTVDGTGVTNMTFELLIAIDPLNTAAQFFATLPGGAELVWDPATNGMWLFGDGGWTKLEITNTDYADGELHRFSLVYDGANEFVQIYHDGGIVEHFNITGSPALVLGSSEVFSVGIDGVVADVRLFDTVRTATEIKENAFLVIDPTETGLVKNIVIDPDTGVITEAVDNVTLSAVPGAVTGSDELNVFDDLLIGDEGDDTLEGGFGDDVLKGGDDDDVLEGGSGADDLRGGSGYDSARYTGDKIKIDLQRDIATGGDAEGDTLSSIEGIIGTDVKDIVKGDSKDNTFIGNEGHDYLAGRDGDDTMEGGGGNDRLFGQSGNDELVGRGGKDTIKGGNGDDLMSGGGGADVFVFDKNDGADEISDFELTKDLIEITSDLTFGDLTIADQSGSTLVTIGLTTVLLDGITDTDVTSDHFLFHDFI